MLAAFPAIRCWWPRIGCCVRARRLVITATTSRQVLASSDYGRGIADQLRTQPENFFDMRQAKVSNRSPDFKHKFKKMQAVWLESSSKDIVQLVQQWDADSSNSQNRPSVMLPDEDLWKDLFRDPDMWYDKRPTENNRPSFVHKMHHFPLWLNQWTPEWAVAGIKDADASREAWVKRQLELGISVESTTEEDKQEEEVDAEAVQEEDVSESWDAEKQQQAVEVLLGSCAGNDFLESVEPTKGITVDLLPHQKRALAWMLHREKPGAKPAVAGGLLADDQGLGKTVTAIALLLHHRPDQEWLSGGYTSQQILTASQAQHPDDDTAEPELLQDVLNTAAPHHESSVSTDSLPNVREADAVPHMAGDVSDSSEDNPAQGSEYGSESPPNRPATGGTLIVAPPSVVKAVWARELLSKVAEHVQLKVTVHHGVNRELDPQALAEFDVVITSYETLRSEHGRPEALGLFNVVWWRVLLDEAHNVKNRHAQRSLAVYDLKAKHRWALSGTPIQNRVHELYSYFHFLQYHPFNTQAAFDKFMRKVEDMTNPEHALERLREMLQPIMLRRTKGSNFDGAPILTLPAKKANVYRLRMSKQEKELYNNVRGVVMEKMQEKHDQLAQEAVRQRRQTAAEAQAWPKASMLAAVVRLRQACTHPSLLPEELQVETANSSSSDDEQMTSSGSQDDQPSAVQKTAVSYAEAVQRIQAQRKDSTKLKRVLRIIKDAQKRPEGPQKIIVFSTFVRALDLMADTLSHSKLGCVMLHGQMTLDERSQALDKFREDPGTRVLLASLLASGTGITVTCASEVVLMEPYWNPFAENQAIDRVHRIGQEHEVTVHKLFMKDTVEERIMELQERKLKMLGAIIEQKDSALGAKPSRTTEADWEALLS